MKSKILAGALCVSLLFNVAGLVFFICFLNLQSHYQSLKRQYKVVVQNMSLARGAMVINDALASDRVIKRLFASVVDEQEDYYGLLPPTTMPGQMNNTLLVYLHGMGSNYLEPFMCPASKPIAFTISQSHPEVGILSCSCRKESAWGNDLAIADLTQNIREVLPQYPFENIVLMGTSMGGCTALTYAAVAPPDVKSKITGVVSVEGSGNLEALARVKRNNYIAMAMAAALGGTPEQLPNVYRLKSFDAHAGELPPGVKVCVVSARKDKIVPPRLQQAIMQSLNEHSVACKLIETDGGHGVASPEVYLQAFDFAAGK